MSLWRRSVPKLLYQTAYGAVLRRAASTNEWVWLRTQRGYFAITKTGALRKTNFSGGAPRAQFVEIKNDDGTISYQVQSGKFKDYYLSLDGDRAVLDQNSAAKLQYDPQDLTLTYKNTDSDANDTELYVNTNTGYFYFGFEDMDKYLVQKKRWDERQGIEKLALNTDGWLKDSIDGYEKVALRYESDLNN
eukprot:355875_1